MVLTLLHLFILCLVHSLSERRTGRIYSFIHINGFHFKFRCAPCELLLGFLLAFKACMYVCMYVSSIPNVTVFIVVGTHIHTLQIGPFFYGFCDDRKTSRNVSCGGKGKRKRAVRGRGRNGVREFAAISRSATKTNVFQFS